MRLVLVVSGLAACLSFALNTAAQAAPFTLSDALSLTYETNPQLAQARAALDALDQGVAQANAGWRPSVNASGSYGIQHGMVGGSPPGTVGGTPSFDVNSRPLIGQLSVTEPLFRGGRTYAEVGRAIAQVRAGRAELIATEQSVLLAAATAYMDVVRDTASLKFNRDNVASLESEMNAVHTELAAGEVTRTDASQAEARLARARADAALAEQQLATSRAAFENVIGRPAETLEAAIAPPRVPATKDMALAVALKQNPNLIEARANERAASYAIDDAGGALLPEISVTGQYQYLKNAAGTNIFATRNEQRVISVLGQVNVPIYQGGGDEATVRRAKDLHRQSDIAILSAQRDVRQNLDGTWQALRSSEIAITANQAQTAADQSAVDGVKQEQQAGERSVLDILNAQQELFSAQIALAASQHDRIVAAYRLLAATGQLTARFLGLRVNLYDPEVHYNDAADAWLGIGD